MRGTPIPRPELAPEPTPRRAGFHPEWTHAKRGPHGRHLCKRCLVEVPKGRQFWCGDACVLAYRAIADPAALRLFVAKRDLEVCALCGIDCALLGRIVARLRDRDDRWDAALWGRYSVRCRLQRLPRWSWGRTRERMRPEVAPWLLAMLGFHRKDGGCLWEADHVVPLTEGGLWGPENVRTACRRCHRVETAKLAKRLAEKRRGLRLPNGAIPLPFPETA